MSHVSDILDELVAAVKSSNPSEEAVHASLQIALDEAGCGEEMQELGFVTATQYAYIDTHVRVSQHQVRQGRRPDVGAPIKVAAIKSYALKFYKEEIA